MSLFTTFVACCFVMCMALPSLPIDKGASLSDRISILCYTFGLMPSASSDLKGFARRCCFRAVCRRLRR